VLRVANFFLVQHTKTGKTYQMTTKYTKWVQNMPHGHKIYQRFPFQSPPEYTKNGIFDVHKYHLATLG
jgi:hypothetical protein